MTKDAINLNFVTEHNLNQDIFKLLQDLKLLTICDYLSEGNGCFVIPITMRSYRLVADFLRDYKQDTGELALAVPGEEKDKPETMEFSCTWKKAGKNKNKNKNKK